jgi:hypothetical protein
MNHSGKKKGGRTPFTDQEEALFDLPLTGGLNILSEPCLKTGRVLSMDVLEETSMDLLRSVRGIPF